MPTTRTTRTILLAVMLLAPGWAACAHAGNEAAVCISFPSSEQHPQGTAAASLPRIRADRPLHAADDCPFPPFSGERWEVSTPSALYGPDSSRVTLVVVRSAEAQTHECIVRPGEPSPEAVCTPWHPPS